MLLLPLTHTNYQNMHREELFFSRATDGLLSCCLILCRPRPSSCFCVLSAVNPPDQAHFCSLCRPVSCCDFPPVCVCFRLADRHTGPAAGGSSTHPPLLPHGAHLPLLQLPESLLQARSRHTLHHRCAAYAQSTTDLSICVRLQLKSK